MPHRPDPPESTHERLNRELSRARLNDVGFWGGWALLLGTLVVSAFLWLNVPTDVHYVTGVAGPTMPLMAEDGAYSITRVQIGDQLRDIRLPSQLVHPAEGETVCLRAAIHRLTGHTSYAMAARTRCDGL